MQRHVHNGIKVREKKQKHNSKTADYLKTVFTNPKNKIFIKKKAFTHSVNAFFCLYSLCDFV